MSSTVFEKAKLSSKDGDVFDLAFASFPNYFCPDASGIALGSGSGSGGGGGGGGDGGDRPAVTREEVAGVPAAFVLHNVLSAAECANLVAAAETMSFEGSCLVGSAVRNGRVPPQKVNWVAPASFADELTRRCAAHLPPAAGGAEGGALAGINPRFRLFKYLPLEFELGVHKDRGRYPASCVDRDGELRYDWFEHVHGECATSRMTMLLYLNDGFEGGETTCFTTRRADGLAAQVALAEAQAALEAAAAAVLQSERGGGAATELRTALAAREQELAAAAAACKPHRLPGTVVQADEAAGGDEGGVVVGGADDGGGGGAAATFALGQRVLCRYGGGDEWYPGAVSKVRENEGTYDVEFDDGDDDQWVPASKIVDESDGVPGEQGEGEGEGGGEGEEEEEGEAQQGGRGDAAPPLKGEELASFPVLPTAGSALFFFSAEGALEPLSPLHEGSVVRAGVKYIIRTDVLYRTRPRVWLPLTALRVLATSGGEGEGEGGGEGEGEEAPLLLLPRVAGQRVAVCGPEVARREVELCEAIGEEAREGGGLAAGWSRLRAALSRQRRVGEVLAVDEDGTAHVLFKELAYAEMPALAAAVEAGEAAEAAEAAEGSASDEDAMFTFGCMPGLGGTSSDDNDDDGGGGGGGGGGDDGDDGSGGGGGELNPKLNPSAATHHGLEGDGEVGVGGAARPLDGELGFAEGPHVVRVRCAWSKGIPYQLWPAATLLSDQLRMVLAPHMRQEGCLRCLELGAGPGLVGLAAASLARARPGGVRAVLTDLEEVVGAMGESVALNPQLAGLVDVAPLRWGEEGAVQRASAALGGAPHVVLGSDLVNFKETYAPLQQTVEELCAAGAVVYLAQQSRFNHEKRFFAAVAKKLRLEVIHETKQRKAAGPEDGLFCGGQRVMQRIYRISSRVCVT